MPVEPGHDRTPSSHPAAGRATGLRDAGGTGRHEAFGGDGMERHCFTLFVAGDRSGSRQAKANLERICREHLTPNCKITVVDVTIDSDLAEYHRVLAIPTLIKHAPAPARRIIGDLSDTQTVLAALGLAAPTSPSKETPHDRETTRE